ncbi:cytochrome c oxidase subunit II [Skermanella rosea]|uniref:cytochrome c oxidase subunit II n=1 Tax=Skermanella rosea TaxID=1817965 RepID=UPI0019329A4F|nr:cytochrome c oxidase subunit II [Skermanella rosea]UEM01340.1 cytochrome c oxidase subunit II [Skermanella rosea]
MKTPFPTGNPAPRPFKGLAAAALLGGCGGPFSTLDPAGPAAQSIATLWWVMLAGSVVLFALVMALFGFAFLRRHPSGNSDRPVGQAFVLWGGLVMPVAVLSALLGYALFTGERLVPRQGDGALRIDAHARQWQWEFAYPDAPGAASTIDVLHIPAGRPVDIHVTSGDVIHSFWAPRLGGKIDAIPGHTNVIRLFADRPGIYHGKCSEFCGTGHAMMGFTVEAHDAAGYPARLTAPQDQPRRTASD